jgi:hypothetical protein
MVRNGDQRRLLRDAYALASRLKTEAPQSMGAQQANDLFHNLLRTFAVV